MKLPKNFFQGLSKERYEQYLKLLPELKEEKKHAYTTIVLTFGAMAVFGLFAISPTLTTIGELKKQLSDSTYVQSQLETKIRNLSTLQQKYTELSRELPVIQDAIPKDPSVALLLGQLHELANRQNLTLNSLQSFQVELAGKTNALQIQPVSVGPLQQKSYIVSVEAVGDYASLARFIQDLGRFNRIVTVESLGITKSQESIGNLLMSLRLRAYFNN